MDDCIRQGLALPDAIQNAPRLSPGLNLFYSGFMELTACRDMGTVLGPLNWLTIQRYCEVHDITDEQAEDMHYYLSHMDAAFLENQRKKQTKQIAAATPPGRRTRKRR